MFVLPTEGAKRALSALKTSLLFNRALRSALASAQNPLPPEFPPSPPYDEWRKLDHAVAVSQLYQIFESFVHDCIAEWLDTISKLIPYPSLPERVRFTHRDGIGYILQNLDGRRFSSISLQTLLREYNEALLGTQTYKLHPDAFLLHDRNLKLEQLQKVISDCGLELSLSEWLKHHRLTGTHDAYQLLEVPSAEKAISSLVDLRNEASHATRQISEICGEEVLIAYVAFVESLIEAIAEGFARDALRTHSAHGAWSLVGKINYVNSGDRSICIAPLESCTVRCGSVVYLYGKYHCTRATIQELRLENVPVSSRTIAVNAEELGLKLDVPATKSSDLYLQTYVPTPPVSTANESAIELGEGEAEDSEYQSDGEFENGETPTVQELPR